MYNIPIAERLAAPVPIFSALIPITGTGKLKMVSLTRKVLPQVDISVIDFKQRRR